MSFQLPAIRIKVMSRCLSAETKARKVIVDLKFDALQASRHREPSKVALVEMLSGRLYWWVELGVPSLHRECYRTL